MSIRWFSTLLIVGSIAFALLCTFFIGFHGEAIVLALLPGIASDPGIIFKGLLTLQLLLLLLCGAVVVAVGYYYFHGYLVRPLKIVMNSMDSFAKGEPTVVPELENAPQELIELANVFRTFSTSVSDAHTHDVEVSRVKSDFISTAAHQLRTPLTGIRWTLEALEKEELNEYQKTLVSDAATKSRDLVAIVGTLLDISAIESGKYKYTFSPVNLVALAEQVTKDFATLAQQMKVTLTFVPPTTPVSNVRADADRVKWVLNNLIENAIRYTPAEGFVVCELQQTPTHVVAIVRDTGIGIMSQDKNNIFERFYRAGNAITKENKGNGLGLYIARTIATDHGGDLTFSANPEGPGTSFVLTLPIAV